jgi:hypothetical protein
MTDEPEPFELFGPAAVMRKAVQRRALARALGAVVDDDHEQRRDDDEPEHPPSPPPERGTDS